MMCACQITGYWCAKLFIPVIPTTLFYDWALPWIREIVAGIEAEAWTGFKTSPHGFCGRLNGTGRVSFLHCHIPSFLFFDDRPYTISN